MSKIKYSIIIPTLANHRFFIESVKKILENSSQNSQIILAYNGDSKLLSKINNEIKKIREDERLKIIQFKPFGGIAKTCNDAYKLSAGRYICYIHDDVIIYTKDWEEKLATILEKYSFIGMIGGSEPKYIDRSPEECQKIMISENEYLQECDWSPTISMTKREYMEKGCIFDEFYLCGLEDKDWALSFRRIGKKVFFFPLEHKHIGNQGSYSLFRENIYFLSYYSKEGPRERYFLNKNKDIIKKEFYESQLQKWKDIDRNLKKSWWKKLYLKYYLNLITKNILRILR